MQARKSLDLPRPKDLKSNKLEEVQNHLRLLQEELDKQWRLIFQDLSTIQVDPDGFIYFGNKDTDGSWRIGRSGNDWNWQRRESGTWTAKGEITTVGDFLPNGFVVFKKASGNGIKIDQSTPTFGFADLLGDQFAKNTGGTKPTLTAYNGAVDAWQFSNGDEAFLSYHIPHDYVLGTDIFLHIHWSQNAAGATGGTLDFRYSAIYSKGHNQVSGSSFTSTPITAIFSSIDIDDGGSGLNQYQQHFTEIVISGASETSALFDRDDFEPDGVIELTLEMDADNLTGTPSSPFIHYVDIHYQTNSIIGTKSRTPDFYA